jgi:hypothetical protein
MSKVAKLLALSVLLAGCNGTYHKHTHKYPHTDPIENPADQAAAEHHKHHHHSHHKHDAMMESKHPEKHHKHDAKGGKNIENQVTKNVMNHSSNVAKDAANTASAVTTAAKSIK